MIIEIDDDFTDTIVQQALVQDYVSLTEDLKRADEMHEDDVEAFKETVAAIQALSKWYFVHNEFEKAVKKARKAK
jgi:lipopolysaccharide biosynthesis regulator YciM